jgi:HAD superfamily hydrolase (TIGR01509 family)
MSTVALNEEKMKRFIFDLDGVLIRTEHLWRRAYPTAYSMVFQQDPPELDLASMQGRKYTEVAKEFLNRIDVGKGKLDQLLTNAFTDAILNVMLRLIDVEATPISESVEFIRLLLKHGGKPALASSSPHAIVEKELELLGLTNDFETIVTGDQVVNSKPDPAIYLLAAKKMRTDPQECLVVEDSPIGVSAAFHAGMSCVMLTSSTSPPLPWQDAVRCTALVSDLRLMNIERLLA